MEVARPSLSVGYYYYVDNRTRRFLDTFTPIRTERLDILHKTREEIRKDYVTREEIEQTSNVLSILLVAMMTKRLTDYSLELTSKIKIRINIEDI